MRISKRVVDAAKPGPKPVFIWDSDLRGFGLLTLPTGTKSFVYQYRTPQGRTRRATIAKVGTIAPDEAREIAQPAPWKDASSITPSRTLSHTVIRSPQRGLLPSARPLASSITR